MRWTSFALVLATAVAVGTGSLATADRARAACDAGEKIDKSTVDDARKKFQAAGYRNIRNMRKGCDNYWHASAEKDGAPVLIVLSPKGEVMTEGD